jgi:hypothetical protein
MKWKKLKKKQIERHRSKNKGVRQNRVEYVIPIEGVGLPIANGQKRTLSN